MTTKRALEVGEGPSGGWQRSVANRIAACFVGYILVWNLWALTRLHHEAWFPYPARWLGYQLRLGQLWGMFSPSPAEESSWLEIAAETSDGTVHWLEPDGRISDGSPTTPERILNERWRKFHERLVQAHPSVLDGRYAAFLLKRFERSPLGAPARVTIAWVRRPSPPPASANQPEQHDKVNVLITAGLPFGDPAPRWFLPKLPVMPTAEAMPETSERSR